MNNKLTVPVLIIFLLAFSYYSFQVEPDVYWLDAGEFILAGWSLGITHNPGYPLYSLVCRIFMTFLPFGSIAYKANIFSAFCASLALGIVLLLLKIMVEYFELKRFNYGGNAQKKGKRRDKIYDSLPFCALVFLFLSSLYISQAKSAEIYQMMVLFFSIFLIISLFFIQNSIFYKYFSKKYLYFYLFFYFLCIVCHFSSITWIGGATLIWWLWKGKFRAIQSISLLITLMVLSFSIYLYLPLRSVQNPAIDWSNTEYFNNFSTHFLAKAHRQLSIPEISVFMRLNRLKEILQNILDQFPLPFFFLIFIGFMELFIREKKMALFMVIILIGDFIYTLFLNVVPLTTTPFSLPSIIVLTVISGIGIYSLQSGFLSHLLKLFSRPLIIILILSSLFLSFKSYLKERDVEVNRWAPAIFCKRILNSVKNDGILFAFSDSTIFISAYLKTVERYREDVIIEPRQMAGHWIFNFKWTKDFEARKRIYDLIGERKGGLMEKGIINLKLPDEGCSDVWIEFNAYLDQEIAPYLLPVGPVFRLCSKEVVKEEEKLEEMVLIDRFVFENLTLDEMGKAIFALLLNGYGVYYQKRGEEETAKKFFRLSADYSSNFADPLINLGVISQQNGLILDAERYYHQAIKREPLSFSAHLNLGILYQEQKLFSFAEAHYKKCLRINPKSPQVYQNLAAIYLEINQFKKGMDYLKKAISIDPAYAPAHLTLSELYFKNGEVEQGKKHRQIYESLIYSEGKRE